LKLEVFHFSDGQLVAIYPVPSRYLAVIALDIAWPLWSLNGTGSTLKHQARHELFGQYIRRALQIQFQTIQKLFSITYGNGLLINVQRNRR